MRYRRAPFLALALSLAASLHPASGQTFEVVHHFDGTEGRRPVAALVEASGALYGTTNLGGAHGLGTIFRRDGDGTVTTLHDFDGSSGSHPEAGLIQALDGDLYGTTTFGGEFGHGTIFRLTVSGDYTVLHDFDNVATGSIPVASLVQADDGSFYGTTAFGGDQTCSGGCGTVFRMDALGNTSTLHSFTSMDGCNPRTLIQADDGALWGTTFQCGGANGDGTIFRITLAGALTTVHDFDRQDENNGVPMGGALLQASDGNLYGVVDVVVSPLATPTGGVSGTAICRVTGGAPHTYTIIAGPNPSQFTDGQAGLIEASDGNLYGTTGGVNHGTVFRTTTGGGLTALHIFDGSDGTAPSAPLVQSADGDLYGTASMGGDNDDGVIFRIVMPASGPLYCPDLGVRRDQMAVFLLKLIHGADYVPPPCTGVFGDVPCPSLFADWVEQLAAEGITAGCGGGDYCAIQLVRRDQMAVFLLKAEHGASHIPPPCTGVFGDVACPSPFADWVEELAAENITAGCGAGIYCPQLAVTRAQMAVFLLKIEHGPSHTPPACQGVFGDVICPSLFADWIEQLFAEGITAGCAGAS